MRKKIDGVRMISTILVLVFSLIVFIPFWNAVVISLQSSSEAAMYPFSWWPREVTLDNYREVLKNRDVLFKAYKDTVFITVVGTVLGMSISVLGAYGFSRKFPGKRFFFKLMLFTMFFNGGLVPTYFLYRNLGLLNTYTACIIVSLVSVYNVIIMKNGFESVPMDLQEAAMIDGANDLLIFLKVMLPLQKPLIATFSLFTIVGYWNSWYWPMILLGGSDKTVLQIFLRSIIARIEILFLDGGGLANVTDLAFREGVKMASVMVVMIPIMAVYPFLQKYFTKGIMVGAVKM